jgi:hypothetical protein
VFLYDPLQLKIKTLLKRRYILTNIFLFLAVYANCQNTYPQSTDTLSITPYSFSASAFYYFIPFERNTVTLIGTADINKLHFESRYNYEDRNTGSVFGGYRFETGKNLQLSVIPMAGIVFGNTDGIAAGLEFELTYKRFGYYAEQEYIFDLHSKSNNFLYVWGEISYSFFDSFSAGICYQKTKVYQNQLDLQRGLFGSFSWRRFDISAYYFNPLSNDHLFIAALSYSL